MFFAALNFPPKKIKERKKVFILRIINVKSKRGVLLENEIEKQRNIFHLHKMIHMIVIFTYKLAPSAGVIQQTKTFGGKDVFRLDVAC